MGIYDRDYMKRRPEENPRSQRAAGSADQRLEGWLQRWLRRYPRLPRIFLGVLALLILAGLLMALRGR